MFIFRPRHSDIVAKAKKNLKRAIPHLIDILMEEVTFLETLTMKDRSENDQDIENSTDSQLDRAEYSVTRVSRVLKAAADVYLKLKLDGAKHASLVKYLNSSDAENKGFAYTSRRLVGLLQTDSEDMKSLHYTELKNTYLYLLDRIESI